MGVDRGDSYDPLTKVTEQKNQVFFLQIFADIKGFPWGEEVGVQG